LAPPSQAGYTTQQSAVITHPDGRSVAQLAKLPTDLAQSISANFPDNQTPQDPNTVSYRVLASIRYMGNGRTVMVTTARPSVATASKSALFGNETVTLNDGSTAWITTGMPGDAPNRVVFIRDDLIITVAGDLPIDALKAMAAQIVIRSR